MEPASCRQSRTRRSKLTAPPMATRLFPPWCAVCRCALEPPLRVTGVSTGFQSHGDCRSRCQVRVGGFIAGQPSQTPVSGAPPRKTSRSHAAASQGIASLPRPSRPTAAGAAPACLVSPRTAKNKTRAAGDAKNKQSIISACFMPACFAVSGRSRGVVVLYHGDHPLN